MNLATQKLKPNEKYYLISVINIKIKVVTNKNIFSAIFRFIILNHFQAKIFIKY